MKKYYVNPLKVLEETETLYRKATTFLRENVVVLDNNGKVIENAYLTVFTGSRIPPIYGIQLGRECQDIDIIIVPVSGYVKQQLINRFRMLKKYFSEVRVSSDYFEDSWYYDNINFCIQDAEVFNKCIYIFHNGIWHKSLNDLINWKLDHCRPKDIQDLKYIVRYPIAQLESVGIGVSTLQRLFEFISNEEKFVEKS